VEERPFEGRVKGAQSDRALAPVGALCESLFLNENPRELYAQAVSHAVTIVFKATQGLLGCRWDRILRIFGKHLPTCFAIFAKQAGSTAYERKMPEGLA
jgi:hypothetical protein